MQIKHRLVILLLVVSVVPTVVIALLLQLSLNRLSERITQDIEQAIIQDTMERLSIHLQNYRESVAAASSSLLISVRLQATEVEKRLAENSVNTFEVSENNEFGFDETLSDMSILRDSWHSSYTNNMDFRRQDLVLETSTQLDDVRDDMSRLQSMTQVYHSLYMENRGKTLWHYTSLENGIHTNYPGGGVLPKNYNPQNRSWYTRAKDNPESRTGSLSYDAATEAYVLTISMSVFRPDGSFAGVTAIDKPMDQIFEGLFLSSAFSGKVRILLAGLERSGEGISKKLLEYMQSDNEQKEISWQSTPKLPILTSSDNEPYQAMMDDLMAGRAGIQVMDYDGEKSIWAYNAAIGEKTSLHMIMPYNYILELADQARHILFEENIKQLQAIGFLLLLIVILVVITATTSAKRFTYPISRLMTVATQLSRGNFAARADVTTGDELETLAAVLNHVGPRLREHEKAQQKLALAGAIQKNLLPKKPPILTSFEIAGCCQYCDETGGDYFDFILPREIKRPLIGIVMGDVVGHGIPAALLMASARSLLRSSSTFLGTDLVELMQMFNDQLASDTDDDKFMTLFYGILNDKDRSMVWASGGHDPAIWYHRKEGTFEDLPNTGPLMGCMKGMAFEQAGPIFLQPNDILVVGTDGIWEAYDSTGNAYGKDRLRRFIADNADRTADEIASAILESVNTFTEPTTPEDDITLVVIKTRA